MLVSGIFMIKPHFKATAIAQKTSIGPKPRWMSWNRKGVNKGY